jgi:hypothetical protein
MNTNPLKQGILTAGDPIALARRLDGSQTVRLS